MNALKILALCAFTLSACGGSTFCDDQKKGMTDLKGTKLAACPNLKASVEAQPMVEGQACTTALEKCSADDQKKLEASVTCINGLAACAAADDNLSSTYSQAMINCSKTGICATSSGCISAFGFTNICALFQ